MPLTVIISMYKPVTRLKGLLVMIQFLVTKHIKQRSIVITDHHTERYYLFVLCVGNMNSSHVYSLTKTIQLPIYTELLEGVIYCEVQ